MNIVITGSIGNIGKPLTQELVKKGHAVTVISSSAERKSAIEKLGAKAAIGRMQDVDFLSSSFKDADIVYLMEAWEGIGTLFDKHIDFPTEFSKIVSNYKSAVAHAGIKRIVHLSSIGAHTSKGTGSLLAHHNAENILRTLPDDVAIKFMRPPAFYSNLLRYVQSIKTQGAIIQGYGGDQKEPWVSPLDIAMAIAEEIGKPFEGRTAQYIASDEVSPNEIAQIIGNAIGIPDLKWIALPGEQMLKGMLNAGMNEWIAKGFVQMQEAQSSGHLYEDYYRNRPTLGKVKLTAFAKEFALIYNK